MLRFTIFLQCLKKERTVSIDPEAILRLHYQALDAKCRNDESIWLVTRGKGCTFFYTYLQKWDVEANITKSFRI
jgi:hypothetical protein